MFPSLQHMVPFAIPTTGWPLSCLRACALAISSAFEAQVIAPAPREEFGDHSVYRRALAFSYLSAQQTTKCMKAGAFLPCMGLHPRCLAHRWSIPNNDLDVSLFGYRIPKGYLICHISPPSTKKDIFRVCSTHERVLFKSPWRQPAVGSLTD